MVLTLLAVTSYLRREGDYAEERTSQHPRGTRPGGAAESEIEFIEAVERGRAQARAGQGRDLDAVNADLERIIAGHRKPN